MQQSVPSRKRPAPGASPLVQQPMAAQNPYLQYPQMQMSEQPDINDFNFPNPYANDQTFTDATLQDPNAFAAALNSAPPQTYPTGVSPAPTPSSTDLVRRARNNQLAQQNGQEVWNGGAYSTMNGNGQDEDEADLEQKVALAKREAQGKRKQIPPFVQKLSSFLDNNDNVQLIRWSDDGRSFIVLDEDEFARTLIPELFKHNNYASFVRQLNMYGFHKTVDIKDGSLRQSEKARKGVKPPSMYSHPYFRKNRPDLLWLIQKPTGKSNAKRKRDGTIKGEADSDEERQYSPGPDARPQGEVGTATNQGLAHLPRSELATVRQELKKLQQQQGMISRMIAQLKEQNDQFYRQATAFQALHDRHENSINAILTFLATFYNRSLEGQGSQNLVNMFNGQGQGSPQQQGGVVEEYQDTGNDRNHQRVQRFVKRPQLLLGAPDGPAAVPLQASGAVTEPNSARQSISPPNGTPLTHRGDPASAQHSNSSSATRAAASPAIKDDAQTPNLLDSVPENDQMMSLINNANASNSSNASTPAFDLSALGDYSTTHDLAPDLRMEVLAMMNQHGGDASTSNNALISPHPPPMQHHMDHIKHNQHQIAELEKLQEAQAESVSGLQDKLGKLSPGGTFPPIDQYGNAMNLGDPPNVNLDDWIHDYNWGYDAPNGGANDDIDLNNFGPINDADTFAAGMENGSDQDQLTASEGVPGKIESLSSQSNTPPEPTSAGDGGEPVEQEPRTLKKKRRTS